MIDLSSSTDPELGVAARVLDELVRGTSIPVMVVGATARDILAGALGLRSGRATADVDVALVVDGWDAFTEFTSRLQSRAGGPGHRFDVLGVAVDVVPCGGVEEPDRTLLWRDDHTMNLFGMHEAYRSRAEALLPGPVRVDVPTAAGLTVLKVVAWTDRKHTTRRDASDLAEILDWQRQGRLLEDLYDSHPDVLERYGFDVDLAASHRLGIEMAAVLGDGAADLTAMFSDDTVDLLASHMPRTVVDRPAMLRALLEGLAAAG